MLIEQGATFTAHLTWSVDATPVDLTGYTARAHVRSMVTSAVPLAALTVGDGITLGGPAGTILLTISAADTALLPAPLDLQVPPPQWTCDQRRRYEAWYPGDGAVAEEMLADRRFLIRLVSPERGDG